MSSREDATVIEVKGLTKVYGQHVAARELSFTVEKGEVVGFLGPNGAGKTTTMNMLTGYLSPTEGTARVGGFDILDEPREVKRLIGYLPENPPLYPEMTVRQYLRFASRIKQTAPAGRRADEARVMELTGIADMRERLLRNLSKGYKQRVGLAQALLGSPPVLVLDEPTIGLDPRQIIEIRNLVRDLGREHTIILSSHILHEVTAVCTRVIIIHHGRIVASDTIANLSRKLAGGAGLTLRCEGREEAALAAVRGVADVAKVTSMGSRESGTVDLRVQARADADVRREVSRALTRAGCTILMMRTADVDLEDIFIQVTREETD
jgi:ABC-2 type transport system ATP-binding protein